MKLFSSRLTWLLLLPVALSSCTMYTSVEMPRPMDLNNLNDIDSVAIINRTGYSKQNKTGRIVEGILTGEAIGADAAGARKCVTGLFDFYSHSLNYKRSVLSDDLFTTESEFQFSNPLPWDTIIALCKEFNVEAIYSLEYFDSNSGVSTVMDGVNINVFGPPPALPGPNPNNRQTVVKLGWRIYVPRTREIRDEYVYKQGFTRPPVPTGYDNYRQKWGAIAGAGYEAGIDYSFRTSDQYVLEGRTMFRGGSRSMRSAGRLAAVNSWEAASEIWMANTNHRKRKIRARAYHNLSVFAERQGNLQLAKEHAQNAFGNKGYSMSAMQLANVERRMEYMRIFEERSRSKQ